MSAYGSSAYGSQPVDATAGVDFSSTSSLAIRSEGAFTFVDGPLTLLRTVSFGSSVLTRSNKRRNLYAGEVYVYERHFFSTVGEDYRPPTEPVSYITGSIADETTLTLTTQPATAFITSRIEGVSAVTTLTLSAEPATAGFTGLLDNAAEGEWVDNNDGGTLVDANA